jgi:DNA helicase-2/ATP-dependent DNA helicase PcrA
VLSGLTDAQHQAASHRGGPLLILGGAGSGKTTALVARFAALVDAGAAPETIAVLAATEAAAGELRTQIEDALGERAFSELTVHAAGGLARRLLRGEALEAGIDPFAALASPADRLGVLLERMDELPLRHHDLQGRPAATLARVIARIDRCKDELVGAEALTGWAAGLDASDSRAAREQEFAALYSTHDRLLAEQGLIDHGELVARAHGLLETKPHVRARSGARFRHVLLDDAQDQTPAALALAQLLASSHADIAIAGDDDQAVTPARHGPAAVLDAAAQAATTVRLERSLRCRQRVLQAAHAVVEPIDARLPKLLEGDGGGSVRFWRCANERAQAQSVAAEIERLVRDGVAPERIGVFVRSVRNEGQAVTVALEERAVPFRLLGAAAFFQRAEVRDVLAWLRLLTDPGDAAAVVRALARPPVELRAVDLARCVQISKRRKLDMVGAMVAATESPQVPPDARDRILSFLKLHRAASGALDTTRPDLFVHRLIDRLGLRRQQLFAAQADVVERLVALSRLGDLAADHVRRAPQATARDFARYLAAVADAGLREDDETADAAAPGSPLGMVAVTSMAGAKGLELDHAFVLGLQASRVPGARMSLVEPVPDIGPAGSELDSSTSSSRNHLLGAIKQVSGTVGRDRHVADMRRLTHLALTRAREGVVLAYAAASDRGARQPPSPFAEEARAALGAGWEDREEELFGPDEALHATFSALRDELLGSVAKVGTRLGELRLDTDLDVTHGVVRYLELVKLAALIERPGGQSVKDALVDINVRLLQATSSHQREVFQTSTLDDFILGADRDERARARSIAAREEPSLLAFLPRRGDGLMLSASDIETYRSCPLRYKFARVFRIPSEPTLNQRFGIVVHQALERFHAEEGRTAEQLLGLLDAAWRRSGFGDSDQEHQLHDKAVTAMHRYQERFVAEDGEPVWLEKGFQFKLGPHVLRGRVDRVDRLPDGGYELIDYKTGRPKTAAQLREDVQLSLYAIGAREAWEIDAPSQAYHYVLDDQKIAVPTAEIDPGWITETVMEVGEGILAQGFEPTPSYSACSMCDYRIACPAAER